MRIAETFDYRGAHAILGANGSFLDFVFSIENKNFKFAKGGAADFTSWFEGELLAKGWAVRVKIRAPFRPTVNAIRSQLCVTAQTGNIARAFYDLLKLEALYRSKCINAACFILPTKNAARILGQNLSNYDRVRQELENIYSSVIHTPLLLLGIED